MTIPHPARRRAAAACAAILTSVLAACGGGDASREQSSADSAGQQSADAAPPQTSTVRVGLTGLILMLPRKNLAGATELFMPNIPGHVAYVGFAWPKEKESDCDEYQDEFKICFMSLEKSRLEPIGVPGGAQSSVPPAVVSVSHTSKSKGHATSMKANSRSTATLHAGAGKNPCSLARWTIDPHPPGDPVESISPANVLTWEIPDVQEKEITLRRRGNSAGAPPDSSFTLPATGGVIELLILHVPNTEFQELLQAEPGPGPSSPMPNIDKQEIDRHLVAFYNLIGAPASQHAPTLTVASTGNTCRIQVLGLQSAVYPIFDVDRNEFGPKSRNGVRTYSCIIAAAEEG